MAVDSKHPSYNLHLADWEACRDVYHGQSAVARRDGGKRYLPPTQGQWLDGMNTGEQGYKNYCAYRDRALLSGFFSDAVDMFLGLLWHRPTTFELGFLESVFGDGTDKPATGSGESLSQLLRRMHVEAMVAGRLGILGDLPASESTTPQPYIELYEAEQCINWDDGGSDFARRTLNLVVLDESAPVRNDDLEWECKTFHRVLWLGDVKKNEAAGDYHYAKFEDGGAFDRSKSDLPVLRQKPLKQIPFCFVGTKSITTQVDDPPLLALARSVLALYRMDADYRQHIHMCGQDTLVTSGASSDEVKSIGAGAHIPLQNPDAKAYFIGIASQGLAETRQAIQNDQNLCAKKAGELLSDNSKQRESADALTQRTGRKGASLNDIADMCAAGLERMLRIIAEWMGATPEQVQKIRVIPNKEFGTPAFNAAEMKQLVESYILGGPVTLKSIYDWSVAHGFPNAPSWEEYVSQRRTEQEMLADLLPMPTPKSEADAAAQTALDAAAAGDDAEDEAAAE